MSPLVDVVGSSHAYNMTLDCSHNRHPPAHHAPLCPLAHPSRSVWAVKKRKRNSKYDSSDTPHTPFPPPHPPLPELWLAKQMASHTRTRGKCAWNSSILGHWLIVSPEITDSLRCCLNELATKKKENKASWWTLVHKPQINVAFKVFKTCSLRCYNLVMYSVSALLSSLSRSLALSLVYFWKSVYHPRGYSSSEKD